MRVSDDRTVLLTTAEIHRILARATELDAGEDRLMTVDDLRRVAADAQVSPEALERALAEAGPAAAGKPSRQTKKAKKPANRKGWIRRRVGQLALMGAGLSLGPLAIAADPSSFGPEAAFVIFGSTGAFALLRGLYHRWRGGVLRYQGELGLVMAGGTLSMALTHGTTGAEVTLVWWLILALVGSAIVTLTTRSAGSRAAVAE